MSRAEIFQAMNEIFRENFDDPTITLHEETSADDIEGWDSLEQINLLIAIEERFGIRFHLRETKGLKNIGELVNLIQERLRETIQN